MAGVGALGFVPGARHHTETVVDDPSQWEEDWAAAVDSSTPVKASFTTGVLTKPLRLSGSGTIRVAASASTSSANLSAVLVDLGPQTIRNYLAGDGNVTGSTRTCVGAATAGDTGCFLDVSADPATLDRQVFSRGWAALNGSAAVIPGRRYTVSIKLASTDHVVPAGHRLALIVAGTDAGLINPPDSTPTLTVDLSRSLARLPVVGGASALAATTWAPTPSSPMSSPSGSSPSGSSPSGSSRKLRAAPPVAEHRTPGK